MVTKRPPGGPGNGILRRRKGDPPGRRFTCRGHGAPECVIVYANGLWLETPETPLAEARVRAARVTAYAAQVAAGGRLDYQAGIASALEGEGVWGW
jgi:hypothetical protein